MGGHFQLTFNGHNDRRLLEFWRGQKVQTALAEVSIMHRVFIGSRAGGANPQRGKAVGGQVFGHLLWAACSGGRNHWVMRPMLGFGQAISKRTVPW